ncbi:DUF1838 family protein [Erythrobacter sp. HL-111]|uniref:DUF1838 family protein n=1 Tax=Erythrobacter sp. HL-111 TaxID=1798193 RepID=UPI0006D9A355|nr:DUF1838 family protein [Erythrobacter sp. HL-111]KPP94895.1 MAG: protein of unknown function DUF1838 [Erythrobacteraceae bacterium HL-111]SDS90134.1 Protein of unknown function [Erythrobacter sp. HL-111]
MKSIKAVLVAATMLAGTAGLAAPAAAQMLDPSDPEDAVEIAKRMQCGVSADEPAVFHWSGNIYGRAPGIRDKLLFKGEGMNIRRCVEVEDPERGKGWRLISRELMLMLDPRTGEVVNRWENPYTGETVDVMHIHNDPVNQPPSFPVRPDGSPFALSSLRIEGDYVFMPFEAPLFYPNPLAGEYQEYVGNRYHAMEIFDFAADRDELFDASLPTAYPLISWVRISPWAPWMKMGGRPGQMVFNAMGRKLPGGFEELPDVLKSEIRANFPIYEDAPPKDDMRPNETTWTKFKLLTDRARAEGKADKAAGGHEGH